MMTNKEIIAVVQAAEEGKTIELRPVTRDEVYGWDKLLTPHHWDFSRYTYRVKQEPREFWIIGYRAYTCEQRGFSAQPRTGQIHVREVLP